MKSLLTLMDVDTQMIDKLIKSAAEIKKHPTKYSQAMKGKTLLMIFEKPSLRTRISFQVAMESMGGSAVVVETAHLPMGQKEAIEDTAKVSSRYVNAIMARLYEHRELVVMSENASVPIINGLTDDHHPVQILCDILTILEKKGKLKGLKLCFLGDGNNNIAHSLLQGCAHVGIDISIGCPDELVPKKEIVEQARKLAKNSGSRIIITNNPKEAVKNADIVYADTWMSYHIDPILKEKRIKILKPYQVNSEIVKYAKKDFIFMNCLPAMRGYEQTAEIIDGEHSVVFDQAENRLHMQKAILLELMR